MGKWESEYGNADLGSRTGGITTPAWDSAEKNTKLLLHLDGDYQDRSRSRHTVTAVNTPTFSSDDRRVQSLVFDGSSSYLTVPDHSDWDIAGSASQDYTIDFWVRHDDHAGAEYYVAQYEDASNYMFIRHIDGSGIRFGVVSDAITDFDLTGGEITDTNWHHVALCKVTSSGPTVEYGLYKDGSQVAYKVNAGEDVFSSLLYIGQIGVGGATYLDGQMANIRISKSNIFSAAPNATPNDTITIPDPNAYPIADANTALLLTLSEITQGSTPATIADSGVSGHDVTEVNTPTYETGVWGSGKSLVLNGTNQYLTVPDHSDWDVAGATDQDYTIDFWVKHGSAAMTAYYMEQGEDDVNKLRFIHVVGSGLQFLVASGGANIVVTPYGGEITDTNWHHVCLVKVTSGGPTVEWAVYLDGGQANFVSDNSTDTFSAIFNIGRKWNNTNFFDGNLDEIRISKSNIFNASPNVGLTDTITVPTSTPTADDDTVLLLNFDNSNAIDSSPSAHTVTEVNTPTYGADVWETDYSLALNGTNQYLTVPDHSDWDLCGNATQDYTIDLWVKHTDHDGTEVYVNQTEGVESWQFYHKGGDGGLKFYVDTDVIAGKTFLSGGEITDTNWHHVALVKVYDNPSTLWAIYLDGTQVDYESDSSADSLTGELNIGRLPSTFHFDGSMSNLRIQKSNIFNASPNVGKTDTITIPTSTPIADDDTVLLLNFDNSDATDTSQRGHIVTNVSQNAVGCGYWYGKSVILNGSTQYMTIPDSADWDVAGDATQDYTIDFWVKHNTYNTNDGYIAQFEDANNYWFFLQIAGSGLILEVLSEGSGVIYVNYGEEITDTEWHHIALIKVYDNPNTLWGIYKDGAQSAYKSDTSTDTFAGDLYVGQKGDLGAVFDGQLDEIRISKSNIFNASPNVGLTDTITVPTRPKL